jgi:DNA-binding PucR family transcriptional regulator
VALVASAGDALGQVRDAVGMLARVPGLDLPFGVSVVAGAGGENGGEAASGGEATGGGEAAGGAGTSWAVADVCRVVAEARQARRLAELLGAGVHMVNSAEFGSSELLLAMVPAEARRSFQAALLTPLLAYDRDHGTELVSTLQVFLANSGSWSKAAEAMFIHVNSLRYRIRRIHELTGRDPRSLEDQAALLLALQIRD